MQEFTIYTKYVCVAGKIITKCQYQLFDLAVTVKEIPKKINLKPTNQEKNAANSTTSDVTREIEF